MAVRLTPAWHNWQNESEKHHTREFAWEDYCGFWIDTPDGSIWAVGDSRLLEEQLHMPVPDAILFDFSDSRWHIGLEGAVKLAAAYPDTPLILWHWGSVDAAEWKEFNGNPETFCDMVVHPQRVVVVNPGEMQYTKLGNSELVISRICMGCMGFGDAAHGQHSWTVDESHSREIMDLGVNFFDTAIGYQSGTSEQSC